MLQSLLISSVSDFEVFLGSLMRESLRFSPKTLRESGRTFTLADIDEFESLEAFISDVADAHVDKLMRESVKEWIDFLTKATRRGKETFEPLAKPLKEVILRRNAFVHTDGVVTLPYTRGAGQAKVKLGDRLSVDMEYLTAALGHLASFALYASESSFAALRATVPEVHVSFDITQTLVDLLQVERYSAVETTAEACLRLPLTGSTTEVLRVNRWLSIKSQKGVASVKRDVTEWDVSSLAPQFRLAKLALIEEDLPAAHGLAQRLMANGDLTSHAYETWPLLAPLRRFAMRTSSGGEGPGGEGSGGG
jgi:hypothetical protein